MTFFGLLPPHFPFYFFILQGLNLLKWASLLCKEAWQLEGEAQHLETEGLEKLEAVVAGSEVEGFYGLLRGAMLHSSVSSVPPSHKKVHHTPSATISHLPPQESQEPKAPGPAEQAPELTSSTAPSVLEGEIPANINPFGFSWGASREFINVRLRVAGRAHQPPMPPFVHMCKRYTWEWGWCAPSATSPFSTLTPSGSTRRVP